ncbi:hypothetical protein [Photobacterium sp. J15]|uniref:hypothetical protein n=1 Tax=Photobacterium sp. J15 TaxID=265901 RepID=UPI0007E34FC6|nr:hypothetical protein [Photobacterium sp. J15]
MLMCEGVACDYTGCVKYRIVVIFDHQHRDLPFLQFLDGLSTALTRRAMGNDSLALRNFTKKILSTSIVPFISDD